MNSGNRILLIVGVITAIFYAVFITKRFSAPKTAKTPEKSGQSLFSPKKKYDLHIVGTNKGVPLPGEDTRVWWEKCKDIKNDRSGECHAKYAGETFRSAVEVILSDLPGNIVLVAMSATTKTRWDINKRSDVNIAKVILIGDHEQTVTGIDNSTQLEVYTRENSPCSGCYRGPSISAVTTFDERLLSLLDQIRELTDEDPKTVQLTEEASSFAITSNIRQFNRKDFEEKIRQKRCLQLQKSILDVDRYLRDPAEQSHRDYYLRRLEELQSNSKKDRCG
jgi:hypothetical protein